MTRTVFGNEPELLDTNSIVGDAPPIYPWRDGVTYQHERDGERLDKQHNRVVAALRDGQWHTLSELHQATGDPEASISARLRDLRKPRFGSHEIERRFVRRGLWEYRLVKRDLFE